MTMRKRMLFAVIQTRIGSDAQKIMGRNPGFEAFLGSKKRRKRESISVCGLIYSASDFMVGTEKTSRLLGY